MIEKALKEFLSIDLNEMRFENFIEKRTREIEKCVENVSKGKGWKDVKQCPLCSSEEGKVVLTRFNLNIVQCESCTLGYVEKFPVDTADVYSHEAYLPIAKSDYLDHVDYRKQRFAKERLEIIQRYLKKSPEKVRLLDVGCGTGWFLEVAKEAGYEISGQEFGEELAAFTAKRLGIQIWNKAITEIPENEKFDVITLFDVIEHVYNPVEVIRSIEKHLNKGGISIIFTPNLDSFCIWKLKERSTQVMPVEHLFYFTEKSFQTLVGKTELKVLDFMTKGMDVPDIYSYYRDETEFPQVAEFLKEHCDVLQAMIDQAGCGNHMRFILKKEK